MHIFIHMSTNDIVQVSHLPVSSLLSTVSLVPSFRAIIDTCFEISPAHRKRSNVKLMHRRRESLGTTMFSLMTQCAVGGVH